MNLGIKYLTNRGKSVLGFTLLELMMAIAIATIVLTLAVPGFRTLIQNNRLTTQTNDLVSALNLARSEAIRRNDRVVLCRSQDQNTCDVEASRAGQWDQGWIVFVDANRNGVINGDDISTTGVDESELLLKAFAQSGNLTLRQSAAGSVAYQPDGTIVSTNQVSFNLCDERGTDYARRINIELSGRPASCHGVDALSGGDVCPTGTTPSCPS